MTEEKDLKENVEAKADVAQAKVEAAETPAVAEKVEAQVNESAKPAPAAEVAAKSAPVPAAVVKPAPRGDYKPGGQSGRREFTKNRRTPRRRPERKKPEFDQKIVQIRRVTRVSAGGRRFSFSVAVVAGDRKGRVGAGIGKAGDTALAIEKAFKNAKKNLIDVKTTETMSIPHEVKGKYTSSVVMMMPSPGRGIIAGSSVRDVVELAGLKDINAKIITGSKNKYNNAQAAIRALGTLKGKVSTKTRSTGSGQEAQKEEVKKENR